MESSQELNSEVSPPILPVTEGPASWTTSQGDDGGMGLDDGDMQDSDDPDTTDNFDQELDEQDQDHVTYCSCVGPSILNQTVREGDWLQDANCEAVLLKRSKRIKILLCPPDFISIGG